MKYLTGSTYSFHRSNDKIAAVVNLLCIYLYLKYDTIERFYSELEVFTFVLRFSLWLVQSQQASPDSVPLLLGRCEFSCTSTELWLTYNYLFFERLK